jgi:hypothetical protein
MAMSAEERPRVTGRHVGVDTFQGFDLACCRQRGGHGHEVDVAPGGVEVVQSHGPGQIQTFDETRKHRVDRGEISTGDFTDDRMRSREPVILAMPGASCRCCPQPFHEPADF